MKNVLKSALTTLAFVFAFFVCGVAKVDAALEPPINNTKVNTNGITSFSSEENMYYVTNDGTVKLTAKTNASAGIIIFNNKTYYARLAIVKCNDLNNGVCREWNVYRHGDAADGTMDDLLKGLTLDLPNLEYETTTDNEIYNQTLGELDSIYGVDNTYFALVQYYQSNWSLGERVTYIPEVYRFALRSDLAETSVSYTVTNGVATLVVKSGTPIDTIKYFASATKLEGTYDYATKFAENSGVEVLTEAMVNPLSSKGEFRHEFNINLEEGKFYYINATDISGRELTYDVDADQVTSSMEQKNEKDDTNVGDTGIGKIILIALLVLLIVSVALVIVQKIVDHRRKLY